MISLDATDAPGNGECFDPQITPDGRFVCFASRASNLVPPDENGRIDIFVRDVQAGRTTRISLTTDGDPSPGRDAEDYTMSEDGQLVLFTSPVINVVATRLPGTPTTDAASDIG
jgi:Tol biopolymer transport system component